MAFLVLIVLLMCSGTGGQVTPSPVCANLLTSSNTTIPKVNLGDEFSVRMEIVTQETNRVTDIRMFYSKQRNQIRLSMLDSGIRSDMYFYFADNEILTFDYSNGRGSCSVIPDLANAADTFIVGGSKDNKIPVPLAVLHLIGQSGFGSDINAVHLGVTYIRDMAVDAYYSCQKWSFGPQAAIVNVTHYFSNKTWGRPDPPIVPVLIEIHGSAVLHNQGVSIDHFYNFFDFQTSVDATIFETPPGIMCSGRNNDLKFPNLPDYIKFSGEALDPTGPRVVYFEEIYDSSEDFIVIRTQTAIDYGTQGGMNHLTIIRDYPSGLSYTIDNSVQTCTTQNITDSGLLPIDYITSQGKVQEISPAQLFYATDAKYEYLGERNIRGMLTDTWVTRTNIPAYPNEEVTVEWYFAKPDVTSWNDGSSYYTSNGYRMPVLLRMWHGDDALISVDTNIYHVDYTKILFGTVNIRDCYPNTQSNYFQIVLKGAKELVVNTNIEQFKWSTALNLAFTAGVRWLRIVDLQIYYDADDAVIEFELLDAPPYASDQVDSSNQAIGLQEAAQNLNSYISSGKLYINVWNSATNQIDKAIKATSSVSSDDTNYSVGAMAGLGIAMVIVGGAGGGVGAHFFLK